MLYVWIYYTFLKHYKKFNHFSVLQKLVDGGKNHHEMKMFVCRMEQNHFRILSIQNRSQFILHFNSFLHFNNILLVKDDV